mmetsp:Transcript_20020/g.28493  ORF Transcript_20020/g.28493 Transcript_20020/m.28493 type:complete len:213 (+) Transcript_20020:90-728(+)
MYTDSGQCETPEQSNEEEKSSEVLSATDDVFESTREINGPPIEEGADGIVCGIITLCSKCQTRRGKASCCEMACLFCCSSDQCEGHSSARADKKLQRELLDGTHWSAKLASELRAKAVKKGAFKEKAIHYLEETCLVWDIDQFERLVEGKKERRGRVTSQDALANINGAAAVTTTLAKLTSKRQRLEQHRSLRFQKFLETHLQKSEQEEKQF